ncbi:MAG: M48 family metallopeptidase [Sphingobacteriaceae bacterium]|nr:M48 family metallopeptidase [Sphingobacteriaceae bacterium]
MKHLHRNIAFFLFVSLQINSFLYSQTANHKFIAFKSEKFDSTDFKKRENELYKKYDSLFINKSWLKEYVQEISTFEQSLSDYGVIYKNWSEASDYLNAVIKEVLGKEWNDNIVVQIRRDEENNAFMIEDGKVYINVGMLASASSEAELAATIGHEYGHYKNLHSYKGFVREQETKARIRVARLVRYPGAFWVAKSSVSGYYSHSRENESEADRTSIDLMKASGYDLSAIAGNFEKFYTEEKKRAREKGYRNFVYYHTHPPTQERLLNSKRNVVKQIQLAVENLL